MNADKAQYSHKCWIYVLLFTNGQEHLRDTVMLRTSDLKEWYIWALNQTHTHVQQQIQDLAYVSMPWINNLVS